MDEKDTTVYKRDLSVEYKLRLKASRAIFSEINKKAPTLPFTIRALTQVRAEAMGSAAGSRLRT
jgi:methionyl aminopeptidase